MNSEHRIECLYCGDTHTLSSEVKRCAAAHDFRTLHQGRADYVEQPQVATVDDVEALLLEVAPGFGLLLDAIAVARGHGRWDLVDSSASLALASVTGEVPNKEVFYAARQIVIARLRDATYDELKDALVSIVAQIQASPAFLAKRANSAIESMESELQELALLITDNGSASLIAAAARLRRLDRPDLAAIASTRAIERNGTLGVALTVRSAAHLDANDPRNALADIERAEEVLPSSYTANVRARLETGRRNLAEAEHWALLANERDAVNGSAGALSMMRLRALQGRYSEASEWASKASAHGGARWSVEWMRLQAANELVRGGNRADAQAILSDLWTTSAYAPARRRLLELRAPVAA